MKKDFIKVDLLPKYKPNENISNVFFTIGIIMTILFVAFYVNYIPYISAEKDLIKARFEYNVAKEENEYFLDISSINVIDGTDIIYNETIEYVKDTQFSLTNRINNLVSYIPDGANIESINFSINNKLFKVVIHVDSDETLLRYEEALVNISWIEDVEFSSSGPGSHELNITFKVGEDNE
ncbi:hypothetical protein RI065_09380 [Mycoplasmatota bacterium zrk1]